MSPAEPMYPAGVLVTVHGLKGDLVARFEDIADNLLNAQVLHLYRDGVLLKSCRVLRAASHKGAVLMHLEGVEGRDQARALLGAEVRLPAKDFVALGRGRRYWFEIEGVRVIDRHLGDIGVLTGRMQTPAHEIYVVEGDAGEVLIPAVPQLVIETLADDGCMHVDLPEGLVGLGNEV